MFSSISYGKGERTLPHTWGGGGRYNPFISNITHYFWLCFCKGLQLHITKEHKNWLTVSELIRSIRKPISIYVDEIVKAFHGKLCNDLRSIGKCTNPADCITKTDDRKLCTSRKHWFKKLKDSHEKGKNPWWRTNCESAQWSEDHWEVAKYFMPALGSNLSTVKDAESTDLSSLLNVIEWMKDAAFLGKTKVNVDLVRKLRSQVRNTWAHASQHELTDDEKAECFSIAIEFLKDLKNVCPNTENSNCLEHLEYLKTNEVTNVFECELQSLLLQRHLLDNIKEEITNMKTERLSDKKAIEEHQQKLEKLKCAMNEWSQKMGEIESFKENINKQFNNFAEDLKSFRGISDDISEIRESIGQIRVDFAKMIKPQKVEPEPTSCLPDKLVNFTGRKAEIQKVIALLTDEEMAVVSLHGGPGFGKTAIAIQVSHKFSKKNNIPVVFSQLTSATNQDEMIRQLCLDVGVNHEDDPKPSLFLWLKNIGERMIWVMDDIDNLLEDKTNFYEFVKLLRKNSNQHCQIITTSRTSCEIRELLTDTVQVDEMDDEACMELLKKQCPEQDDIFLRKLAELCGYVPLAMCIAGSLVDEFEDSDELLQHLEKQPMKTLKYPNSNQYVNRAINLSYEKCSDEEQETLIRFSVFEGSFSKDAAKSVYEKDTLDTTDILQKLVSRSLIKQPAKRRYSMHLLIKHFLKDKQEGGDEKAEQARKEAMHAELLMAEHYLELGHQLTMESYSKDGYKDNREALKREASNIQKVLKICSQQEDPAHSDISDCVARSKIYAISAKFFSLFVRSIISGSIVDKFLIQCANLAEEKKQHAIKINFDCLLAEQERNKTISKPDDHFISKMEKIKEEFDIHFQQLKEKKSLCAHFYYQYGRYLMRKSENEKGDRSDLQTQARIYLMKSLELREKLTSTLEGKADKIFALLQLGNAFKKKSKSNNSIEQAQTYYTEAIQLSQDNLGDHELTSSCYKHLGDLLLTMKKHKFAEKEYNTAKIMRENLGLDASEGYVFLLNNLGACLAESKRAHEAIEVLEKARDMAEKLGESNERTVCKTKVYATLAIAYDLVENDSEAVSYANKALKFEEAMNKETLNKLRKIVSKKY